MKFEVRNKVYCRHRDATGTIIDIKPNEEYPIYVTFEDGNADTYTKSGKRLKSGPFCLELIENGPEALTLELVEGLGKVFTLSCGTRILKTIENTHIILPQTPNL